MAACLVCDARLRKARLLRSAPIMFGPLVIVSAPSWDYGSEPSCLSVSLQNRLSIAGRRVLAYPPIMFGPLAIVSALPGAMAARRVVYL